MAFKKNKLKETLYSSTSKRLYWAGWKELRAEFLNPKSGTERKKPEHMNEFYWISISFFVPRPPPPS